MNPGDKHKRHVQILKTIEQAKEIVLTVASLIDILASKCKPSRTTYPRCQLPQVKFALILLTKSSHLLETRSSAPLFHRFIC